MVPAGLDGATALTLSRNAPGAHPEQPGSSSLVCTAVLRTARKAHRLADPVGPWPGAERCVSDRLPGRADAVGLRTTL